MQSEVQKAAEVLKAVKTMAEIFNRHLSDAALELWTEELTPHHSPELLRELKHACRAPKMPGIAEILEWTLESKRRNASIAAARLSFDDMVRTASTPEARAAAEQALAIMRDKFK